MLSLVVAAAVVSGQIRTQGLPQVVYELPIIGGQREMILGPKPSDFLLLNGFLEIDFAAKKLATPSNTGEYVDSWAPSGTKEEPLGYFDCSTKPGSLFDKPCMVITTTAKWNQKIGKKPRELTWQNYAKQQYWVADDGTILRHFSQLQTPEGTQMGDCTYSKESVQRRYTDVHGQTSFGEVFPSCGMEGLNAQFKPIFAEGKVLQRSKDFWIVNPLTGGLDKYSIRSSGRFKGTILNASFQGQLFDIDGPNKLYERVFLDDKGDVVRVTLDESRYFVISTVPKSHLDEYGRPVRSGGGG